MVVRGTALPPNLLLAAKVIVVVVIAHLWLRFPDRYLPSLRLLDHLPASELRVVLEVAFGIAAFGLLFNRAVRVCSVVAGVALVLVVLGSQPHFEHNRLFAGCALVCIGLYQRGRPPWLLCGQVALVYFGAGLSKLVNAGWTSGRFMAVWGRDFVSQGQHLFAPDGAGLRVAQVVSWVTICTELFLALGFLLRAIGTWLPHPPATRTRFFGAVILVGVTFHIVMFVATGITFGVFFVVAPAVYLALVDWPDRPVDVLYDGDCGLCEHTRRLFERMDPDRTFRWLSFRDTEDRHGIPDAALEERMHLVDRGVIVDGFTACKRLVLYTPAVYLVLALAMGLATRAGGAWLWPARLLAALFLFVFLPPFKPIGDAMYALVARNRHRLGSPDCPV